MQRIVIAVCSIVTSVALAFTGLMFRGAGTDQPPVKPAAVDRPLATFPEPPHPENEMPKARRIREVAEFLPNKSVEPRIRVAAGVLSEIDERESRSGETAEQISRDLDRLIDDLQSAGTSLTGSGQVAGRLADLAGRLHVMAKDLIAKTDVLTRDQDALRKLYSGAPPTLQGAATMFTHWADEEPYSDLKTDYRSTAKVLTDLSKEFIHRRDAIPLDLLENSAELKRYLERCALFLDRYEQAMRLVAGTSAAPQEEYLEKLTRFRDGFRTLRQQFARYAETIKANY